MKKRILASFLSLVLVLSLMPASALTAEGSSEDPAEPTAAEPVEPSEEEPTEPEEPAEEPGEPVPCTLTEGCTLEHGHEGTCVLADEPQAPVAPTVGEPEEETEGENETFDVETARDLQEITIEGPEVELSVAIDDSSPKVQYSFYNLGNEKTPYVMDSYVKAAVEAAVANSSIKVSEITKLTISTSGGARLRFADCSYISIEMTGLKTLDITNADFYDDAYGGWFSAANVDHQIPAYAFYDPSNIDTIYPFSGDDRDVATKFRSIGLDAFSGTRLSGDIVIPDTVTEVAGFNGTKITGINKKDGINYFDGNITTVGQACVYDVPTFTGGVVFGEHVTTIAAMAFQRSGISGEIVLGPPITTVSNAFSNCSQITSVRIGSTVQDFDTRGAFQNCTALKSAFIEDGATVSIGQNTFTGCEALEYIYCGDGVIYEDRSGYPGIGSFSGDPSKNIVLNTANRLSPDTFSLIELDGGIVYVGAADILDDLASSWKVTKGDIAIASMDGGKLSDQECYTGKTSLATPTKEGCIFAGWYADRDFSGEVVTAPAIGQTYYAKWIELTADAISMEYGSEKELSDIKIEGVDLTGWTSTDPDVVEIAGGKMVATGVGKTTITARAALTPRSGERLTVDVTVTPMPITFGTGDGENPGGTIVYPYADMAPELAQFAKFYPAKVEGGSVSVVEGSKAVTLTEGTDIVFIYDAGAGEQEYDYLPIDVTADQTYGIEVTIKLVDPNYRFVTTSNTEPSETIKENVVVKAEGKTEAPIIGLPAVGEDLSYAYAGKGIAPIGNLSRISAGSIDRFTVHFHPWGDTDFAEAHLESKLASELTTEAIAAIAPKEPGSYLMIVDGMSDTEYVYQSWIYTITKAAVTVKAEDKFAYVGEAMPELTYTVSGLASGDSLGGTVSLSCEVTDTDTAGTYIIVPSGGEVDGEHYTLSHENGTLTIARRSSGGGSSSSSSGSSSGDHMVSVDADEHGAVTVSPKWADKGDTVTVTVRPDKGYELDELTVADKKGDTVELKDRGNGKFTFTMPGSKVTVKASFKQIHAEPEVAAFVDVPADAWYAEAVAWAVKEGIASGTSATTFAPDGSCTRAQMVTFLWRANGSPVVDRPMSFADVPIDAYYAEAVRWAVSEGITTGTATDTFSPDAVLTRGQTVTFLWRANGSPAGSGSRFGDVAADAYYANAVAWAVSEGITSGTDGNAFSPDAPCTRAQIVTFMYRDAR